MVQLQRRAAGVGLVRKEGGRVIVYAMVPQWQEPVKVGSGMVCM